MKDRFETNYASLEKFQKFVINDLINATIKANANFLVAMGVFNYIEILGSFTYPEGSPSKRFNHTLERLFPNSYMSIELGLDKFSGNKGNLYEIFRCGMTHEYIIKTYIKRKDVNNVKFEIFGVNNEITYQLMTQIKNCGIEILTLNNKDFIIKVYNPCLIRDLNFAFETYKTILIEGFGTSRETFNSRCKAINFHSFV